MFIAALFTIYRIWKQHKCPSRDDMCIYHTHTHTHTHTHKMNYSAIKNEILLFVTTWIDLEDIVPNEIS